MAIALTRDHFSAARGLRREPVEITLPGMTEPGVVWVHQLSARDRTEYELALREGSEVTVARIREALLVVACRDEAGNPLFAADDVEWLGREMAAAVLEPLVNAARRMNAVSDQDLEGLAKN
jgi:hypothetical protein